MKIIINHYKLKNCICLSILYVHMHAHMCVLGNMCGCCKKTMWSNRFSLSITVWGQGIKLRSSSLTGGTLTC